ncbi:PRTRC system protein C [Ottowia sp.]|uniref:PRTRC system protein C n=1 Tax=Ottowia sp. TaxID=1898956 RepID=UPI0025E9F4EC|nr:PRTRC system protein C [Ottowia sp.]MBK6616370.1 PRTRC system protein C [Ottowia sp.]
MALQPTALTRKFTYNGMELPDPGSTMTPMQVRDLFSATYPELCSAAIDGPKVTGGVAAFSFVKAVHDKGNVAL